MSCWFFLHIDILIKNAHITQRLIYAIEYFLNTTPT